VGRVQRPFLVGRRMLPQRRTRSMQCLRLLRRRHRPASRYTRYTRLWFATRPARRNSTYSRRYPNRGLSRANCTS
jgi:hypothetical protein